jgi:hypothetical protein
MLVRTAFVSPEREVLRSIRGDASTARRLSNGTDHRIRPVRLPSSTPKAASAIGRDAIAAVGSGG